MGHPIFFTQCRTTKKGKTFRLIKFRSMTNKKDSNGDLLPDEQRMTKFGKWLRATSLDELPELLNIIAGNMSVIGPRPFPPTYNDYYKESEKGRFKVRGGLIPPEVLYNDIQPTWDNQLKYESEYGNNLSFKLDLKIFFKTVKGIFKRYKNDYGEYVRQPLDIERKKQK